MVTMRLQLKAILSIPKRLRKLRQKGSQNRLNVIEFGPKVGHFFRPSEMKRNDKTKATLVSK